MKKFIIGGIAAITLALGLTASNASAYWTTRTTYTWDPVSGVYVPVVQRVWVPDPVVYAPSYFGFYPYRSSYYPGWYRYGHHEHHEHHEHHHHH